jgi:hypothetical protein
MDYVQGYEERNTFCIFLFLFSIAAKGSVVNNHHYMDTEVFFSSPCLSWVGTVFCAAARTENFQSDAVMLLDRKCDKDISYPAHQK